MGKRTPGHGKARARTCVADRARPCRKSACQDMRCGPRSSVRRGPGPSRLPFPVSAQAVSLRRSVAWLTRKRARGGRPAHAGRRALTHARMCVIAASPCVVCMLLIMHHPKMHVLLLHLSCCILLHLAAPHDALIKCLERRIADRKVLKLIRMRLESPVVETDDHGRTKMTRPKQRTPQGGLFRPCWQISTCTGSRNSSAVPPGPGTWANAKLIRYADDFVVLARYQSGQLIGWIERMLVGWIERMLEGRFRLTINREKTRVVKMRHVVARLIDDVLRSHAASRVGGSAKRVRRRRGRGRSMSRGGSATLKRPRPFG
jgi:hypothetical protein